MRLRIITGTSLIFLNNMNEYKTVVIKVGFINEKGEVEGEAVRRLEWDGTGVSPKAFMNSVENFAFDTHKADVISSTII